MEAIQRVYFNIGSCAEQCWVNHLTDLRAADPEQRNYGQTPFDIGQCRRDCPTSARSRTGSGDIRLLPDGAADRPLAGARPGLAARPGDRSSTRSSAPARSRAGAQVFAENCARCHSSASRSSTGNTTSRDRPRRPDLRLDWLGNDQIAPASEVGTYPAARCTPTTCRARVWAEYASQTEQARPADPLLPEVMKDGGRGYYRNISLLSLWAHAPFMHNNAIGPEICGQAVEPGRPTSIRRPTSTPTASRCADPPACWPYDPSVDGRFELYKASMEALLNPDQRIPKMFVLDEDIVIDIAPKVELLDRQIGLTLTIPAGFPAVDVNSLRFKDMMQDLVLVDRDPAKLEAKYARLLTTPQ